MSTPPEIGFIGLGIMGRPMVKNLLRAGYPVVAYNRSQPAIDEVAAAGAQAADSVAAVAAKCGVVITMLPDTPDVLTVWRGEDGLLARARPGALLIDMSTIAPPASVELAAAAATRGLAALDAPVSGGDKGAIAGTLSIMVGGEAADFERARPIFAAMGKTIVHCGPAGAGQTVKACNQIVVALVIGAVSEALVLGAKAGVSPTTILEVLGGGLAQNRVMELRGPNMVRGVFEPGFKARLHHKDLGLILDAARRHGASLPLTALVSQLFTQLVATGRGELDHSALLTVIEDASGCRVAAGPAAG
jgi:2-hydroxy-3-oxopropionate reductase